MDESKLTSSTPHLPVVNQQSSINDHSKQQQQQQQQLKKLYFKPSATEALHSAILLKARNPTSSSLKSLPTPANTTATTTTNTISLNSSTLTTTNNLSKLSYNLETANDNVSNTNFLLMNMSTNISNKVSPQPKHTNLNFLHSISVSSDLNPNNNNDNNNNNNVYGNNSVLIAQSEQASKQQTVKFQTETETMAAPSTATTSSSQSPPNSNNSTQNTNNNNYFYSDEFDSPLNIKENIFASIKNLKPVLDPLRSSTSDEEDSHSDNFECKSSMKATTIKPEEHSTITTTNNNPEIILLGTANKMTIQTATATMLSPPPQISQPTNHPRSIYFRVANSLNFKTQPTKFINNINIGNTSSNTSTSHHLHHYHSTVILTKTPNGSLFSNNLVSGATHLVNRMGGSKRDKEEAALSNSSSSDEESDHHNQNQRQSIRNSHNNNNAVSASASTATSTSTILIANPTNSSNTNGTTNNSFKLQQIILSNGVSNTQASNLSIPSIQSSLSPSSSPAKSNITPVVSSSSALTTTTSTYSCNNKFTNQLILNMTAHPHITPVVNSTNVGAMSTPMVLVSPNQPNSSAENFNSPNSSSQSMMESSESQSMNSPSFASNSSSSASPSASSSNASSVSISSQKSSIDHDFANSSIASPTSCCSSVTTTDSNIDLNDDSSSTASGPIYIRQPGFDYHAHEIISAQHQQSQQISSSAVALSGNKKNLIENLKSFKINEPKANRVGKLDSVKKSKKSYDSLLHTNNIKQVNSGSLSNVNEMAINKSSPKAKKKFCMMLDGHSLTISANETLSAIINDLSNSKQQQQNNIQLKPLSNKAKREPLPMRLRALPPSFWQQPNQPNVSPGTMYLPPLFKNGSIENGVVEDNEDGGNSISLDSMSHQQQTQNREVRISPANTDLLFKLFETAEQNSRDKKQLHLQAQYKLYRNSHKPIKSMSKALIKGDDPCIVDAVSEGLFPLLRLDSRTESSANFLSFKSLANNGANNSNFENAINSLTSNGMSSSSPNIISASPALTAINSMIILNNNSNGMMTMINGSNSSNNNSNNNGALPMLQLNEQNYAQALSEVVAAL